MSKFVVRRSDLRTLKPIEPSDEQELCLIGYWKESDKDNYIDPSLLIDPKWAKENKEKVVEHLMSGTFCEGYMGQSRCRICKCKNGGTELTDGVWYWPQGLAHYVEDHNVRLPDEFIEYTKLGDKLDYKVEFDWNQWCMQEKEINNEDFNNR